MDLAVLDTPVDKIEITVDQGVLTSLRFVDALDTPLLDAPLLDAPGGDAAGVADRLRAYFAGDLAALDAVPVRFDRGTPFQREVWQALRAIPVGETISYAELARRVGRPGAFRAVGAANGQNPVGIVVPCHRVIAADGSLGGYGGGLDRKRWLLAHEGALADASLPGLAV